MKARNGNDVDLPPTDGRMNSWYRHASKACRGFLKSLGREAGGTIEATASSRLPLKRTEAGYTSIETDVEEAIGVREEGRNDDDFGQA